ncbi:aldehyde dehydrogenase family protein [Plantactinospora endophytica]|uniref:Benzaldehyde dehydrogenase n=1 Tax=Plantactinospora endophytica TaxID=673535 RepID=A0ABQ4E273_9ACTN|nr:aldehyde dehydrogenase family protein [Plantactinospora endophytica]GIG88781.1 benzaldehyde dehydrogenase [Plantactinospora endophytica]
MTLIDLARTGGKVYSGGWREPAGGSTKVVEPATGVVLAEVGVGDAGDIDDAVRAAARAQPGWQALPAPDRAAVLRRAALVLVEHTSEVVEWLIRESGSVRGKAEYEVASAADELWAAATLPMYPHGELLPDPAGRRSVARRVPVGTVGVISPWNVPLLLALRAVAPALALGNAVVLKPDPRTAVSGGHAVAAVFDRAGLPEGVLHVLAGGPEAGEALVRHSGTDMIAFTGSSAVGRQIGATAGGALKRVSLELGGNNALLVLDDADVVAAASAGAWSSFFHQGQVCMSAGRHIVVEAVADRYVDALCRHAAQAVVGDPWTEQVGLGPLIDLAQRDRVDRIVRESIAAGAMLREGGSHDGLMYRPTVLTGVTPELPAFREEIFGPVAPVIVVADEDEAVRIANLTEYGLVASVYTGSATRGAALADRLATGIVHVNDPTVDDNAYVPFGGRGASGNGHRHGIGRNTEEFTQWQWLTLPAAG